MDTEWTQEKVKTGEIGINKEKKTALDGTVLLVRNKRHFVSKTHRFRHYSLCSLAFEP